MSQRIALQTRSGTGIRRPAPSGGRAAPALAMVLAAGRLVGRRPGLVFASVAVAGGIGVFGWNALMKQSGVHPAPLFAGAKPAVPSVEPPRRPDFPGTTYARAEPSAAATTKSLSDPLPSRSQPAPGDAIGSLIKSGGEVAKTPEAGAAKPAADPKANAAKVLAVQKALLKAGYGPIGTDGVAGSVTRQALERFERDRNLPVTGTLAPRTLKQLASASGMRIE